jgi:hydroxymethylpyrimidine/phosphomethylpyrimidine kinase
MKCSNEMLYNLLWSQEEKKRPGDRGLKYVLTIAGSDSSGGAGIQADIKTVTSLGAHALTVITAVTAQNSTGISGVHELPAEFIAMQIESVVRDVVPDSVKIGMLSSGRVIETVVWANLLLPLARVITPNLHEAGILAGCSVINHDEMELAAKELKKLGPDVIITGGHLVEGMCMDILYDGQDVHHFHGERIATENTHGTGCVFSSSLACFLAKGSNTAEAARCAGEFTRRAIENGYPCGRGAGPVSPLKVNGYI